MRKSPDIVTAALSLSLWLLVFVLAPAVARADRETFLAAERALQAGDLPAFERLAVQARADPLHPYLRFAALTRNPALTPDADLQAFLDADPETPLAERLRVLWLDRLAAAGQWSIYARVWRPEVLSDPKAAASRECHFLRALLETGRRDEALARLEPVWLTPTALPAACEPALAAWRAAGQPTPDLIWRRIRLLLAAGQPALVPDAGGWLPEAERPWLDRWRALDRDPTLLLREPDSFAAPHPLRAGLLARGLERLARASPRESARALSLVRAHLAEDPDAADRALAAVGRALTESGDPGGLAIWDGMRATPDNLTEQETRLRAAIALEAWSWLPDWIGRMPDGVAKRDRWLYWLGRAEAALGRDAESRAAFAQAAGQRSFWGFLAADRLGLPYRLDSAPTPADPARIRALDAHPALTRVRALRELGRDLDARREWRFLTQPLAPPDLLAAATLARDLGWHDQAIATLARADYWDDLELRFPLAHRSLVETQAAATGIPPDWILATIRQESLFAPDAASSADALGLMQLLPATAREVAARLGKPAPTRRTLLDPATNIALGAAYLAELRERFAHPALVAAAYNAGPHRVERWLPERPLASDLWIARIPFRETRGYVERVLAYRILYAARLGQSPPSLAALLPPIPERAPVPPVATTDEAGQSGPLSPLRRDR